MTTSRIHIREDAWLVEDIVSSYNPDGTGTIKLPVSQRQWAWKHKTGLKKMMKLVDSVMMGFPIPTCIMNRISGNEFQIYDGRHRIETLWNYVNDKFKWDDKLYSELSADEKTRFNERKLPLTILVKATPLQLTDVFIRLNNGIPLKDYDMFWANKDTPLVSTVERYVYPNAELSRVLGGLSLSTRNHLSHWVGLVYGLATNNSGNMTTSYLRISMDEDNGGLNVPISVDANTRIQNGIRALCSLYGKSNVRAPVSVTDMKSYRILGKITAFFLDEWMKAVNKNTVVDKWVDIIVKYRTDGGNMKSAFHATGTNNLNSTNIANVIRNVNHFHETGELPPDNRSVASDDDPDDE